MTTRRGFLAAILAGAVAPAIVKAGSIMQIKAAPSLYLWGDGVHDDTEAMQALFDGLSVRTPSGILVGKGVISLPPGEFLISNTIEISAANPHINGGGHSKIRAKNARTGSILNVSYEQAALRHDEGFRFENLHLEDSGSASACALQLPNVPHRRIYSPPKWRMQ